MLNHNAATYGILLEAAGACPSTVKKIVQLTEKNPGKAAKKRAASRPPPNISGNDWWIQAGIRILATLASEPMMTESDYIFEVSAENFGAVVLEGSRSLPVLVDFWAPWCGPCKTLTPILTKLAEEYRGKFVLAKINTEEQQELAAQFGIRSIPTVRLFKNGQPVDEFMGALPETELRAFLDRHIPRESDRLAAQANQLARQGDLGGAVRLMEEAKNSDPDNPRVLIAYARLKAILGNTEEAEQILAALPPEELENPEVAGLKAQLLFDRIAQTAPALEELQQRLATDPNDNEARYLLAARYVMEGGYEPALEQLLTLLRKNRDYADDAARKGMLAIFEILGGNDPLVNRYRNRMFNALH